MNMRINNIKSDNQNFYGYKNAVTSSAKLANVSGFTFLSMQLDNIGHRDLDAWNNIQRNILKKPVSDIFTMELFNCLGDLKLLFSLYDFRPDNFPKRSQGEMETMKAFTWLSSLTKRLMNDNHLVYNNESGNVLQSAAVDILPVLGRSPQTTLNVIRSSTFDDAHPQLTAKAINDTIDGMMKDYFA